MKNRIFVLTKCYDEGLDNIAVIESTDWETAVQYILDRPELFEPFLYFLKHPQTIDDFEKNMGDNWLDGDSWPEIRLRQIDTVYEAV